MRMIALSAALLQISTLAAAPFSGTVRDVSGAPVAGATVQVVVTQGGGSSIAAVLAQTLSLSDGAFLWSSTEQPPFRIRVSAPGFAVHEAAIASVPLEPVDVVLMPESAHASITVSVSPTTRGIVEDN